MSHSVSENSMRAYQAYLDAGWHPVPVRPDGKALCARNTTGYDGVDLTAEQLEVWAAKPTPFNIAVRMPIGVIGIDVDDYQTAPGQIKVGHTTLRELADRLGELPPTFMSTRRGFGNSGIFFFRVPEGTKIKGTVGLDIDAVQRHHRYAAVWPSYKGGDQYNWYSPDGTVLDGPPNVSALPELPQAWIDHLVDNSPMRRRINDTAAADWVEARPATMCLKMQTLTARHMAAFEHNPLHDAATRGVFAVINAAAEGHGGVEDALEQLRQTALRISDERGRDEDPEAEFQSLVEGAIAKTHVQAGICSCQATAEESDESYYARRGYDWNSLQIVTPNGRPSIDFQLLWRRIHEPTPILRGAGTSWSYTGKVWTPDGLERASRRLRALTEGKYSNDMHTKLMTALKNDVVTFGADTAAVSKYINFKNGILDVRTGELHPHTPGVHLTTCLPVEWDESAPDSGNAESWIAEVVGPDNVQLVYEMIGTCMVADQPLHRAFMLVGTGRNGKGTLIRLITSILGVDNISAVTPQNFSNTFAGAELFGKLANLCGDASAKAFTDTEAFKMATGGDVFEVQRKFGQPFRFVSYATIVAAYNELPRSLDNTDGFYDRWIVINFPRSFSGQEDSRIEDRLQASLTFLAYKGVEAVRRVYETRRYSVPADSEGKSALMRASDPIYEFIDDTISAEFGNGWISKADLYGYYVDWARTAGVRAMGKTRFCAHLVRVTSGPNSPVMFVGEKRKGNDGPRGYVFKMRGGEDDA